MRKNLLMIACGLGVCSAFGQTIDFDRIQHWTGKGLNRAALVIQFETPETTNPGALVWGYRWGNTETPTGYDMLTEIAKDAQNLAALVQLTGTMGYTLDGVGYAKDITSVLSGLSYDLEGAAHDERISFGFYDPNTAMGQTHAPGDEALSMALEAIEEAKETHVILHPLNYEEFGYPAYDYDWWTFGGNDGIWNSGWYDGYWGYYVGRGNLDSLGYSGLGMSSVELADGDIHGWRYMTFGGEEQEWLAPVYVENTSALIPEISEATDVLPEFYTIGGVRLSVPPATGIYIERRGNVVLKRIANQ